MSLNRLAIRLATVAALSGRTMAKDAVRDSEIAAADGYGEEESRPFVAIYTDDSRAEGDGGPRDLLGFNGSLSIVIEIGVTARMQLDGGEWDTVIPQTDAGMELTLDYIERQVRAVLSDDGNPWSEIWRRLIRKIEKVGSVRGASDEKKMRFAGRQIEITVLPISDPALGREPTGVWADFLAQMEADDDLAGQAKVLRALIKGEGDAYHWQMIRRERGLSEAEADALLITTPSGAEADVTVVGVNASPAKLAS